MSLIGLQLRLDDVAPHLVESLATYAEERIAPGGFLLACLQNDFVEAVKRADHENIGRLWQVADWIYNELPGPCWGSKDAVQKWIDGREEMLERRARRAAIRGEIDGGGA